MKIKQIYVINLKRRKDKLKKMMKRLNTIDPDENINVDIFRAIDGKNINEEYLQNKNMKILSDWVDPFKNTKINCGEIGCAESHYRVWELIVKNNYNHALILEDDACFSDNFINKVDEIELPNNTDIVYFGRKKFVDKEKKFNSKLIKPEFSYWLVGYYLTYSGALKLVQSNFMKNIIPVDEFVPIAYGKDHPSSKRKYSYDFKYNKLIAYALNESLIRPSDGAFMDSETEDSLAFSDNKEVHKDHKLKILTFIQDNDEQDNDYFNRFRESTVKFNLQYVPIIYTDSKTESLEKYLKDHKDDKELLLITDYRNTVFTSAYNEIIDKFIDYGKDILFGCSKVGTKENILPGTDVYRYLNKSLVIGYSNKLKECLDCMNNVDKLKEKISNGDKVGVDHNCQLFFDISDSLNDFNLDVVKSRLLNNIKHNTPVVVTCNDGKINNIIYDNITNYIPLNYRASYGYNTQYDLKEGISSKKVLIEIDHSTHTKEIMGNVKLLDYPKKNIKIVYYNGEIKKKDYKDYKDYIDIVKINKGEIDTTDFDYVLHIDENISFKESYVLKSLIKRNKNIIAPFVVNKKESKPNYGMFIDKDNNKPTPDFNNILHGHMKGCWKVTELSYIYLIKCSVYKKIDGNLQHKDYFMYVDNTELFGEIM